MTILATQIIHTFPAAVVESPRGSLLCSKNNQLSMQICTKYGHQQWLPTIELVWILVFSGWYHPLVYWLLLIFCLHGTLLTTIPFLRWLCTNDNDDDHNDNNCTLLLMMTMMTVPYWQRKRPYPIDDNDTVFIIMIFYWEQQQQWWLRFNLFRGMTGIFH